jgi:glycosyltransferase involved in cell wall biosynthesis
MQKITKNPILKRISGTINNTLSTSIIAVSDSARNRLIEMGCDPQKISTVVNGVSHIPALSDTERIFLREKYGLTKDNFVISYFARLEEYKGHKTLLDAAKICKKCHPNFRFFIIGTGAYETELKRYTHELEIDDIVHFCGFLDDVAPIFNITDINLNCSYLSETASLSISEGMSLGIPCVASDIDGNSYMVRDGENGLLFPAKSYNSLSAALTRLYCDKELYKTCSNGALLRYHDELNDKKMCQKMTSIYLREYRKSKSKKYAKKINPLKL